MPNKIIITLKKCGLYGLKIFLYLFFLSVIMQSTIGIIPHLIRGTARDKGYVIGTLIALCFTIIVGRKIVPWINNKNKNLKY